MSNALWSSDFWVRRRAIDYIRAQSRVDLTTGSNLLQLAGSNDNILIEGMLITKALGRVPTSDLAYVVPSFSDGRTNEAARLVLLSALAASKTGGRAGAVPKSALNPLFGRHDAAANVVLAAYGIDREKRLLELEAVIKEHSERRLWDLWLLIASEAGDWLPDRVIRELAALASSGENESVDAAVVLGRAGRRAVPVLSRLRQGREDAKQRDRTEWALWLPFEIAIARIEGRLDGPKWLEIFAIIGRSEAGLTGTQFASLDLALRGILAGGERPDLQAGLRSDAREVVVGAANCSFVLGLDAKTVAPSLLRLAIEDRRNQVQEAALYALATVGGKEMLQSLSDVAENSDSDTVRRLASEAAKAIRLGP